MNRSVIVFLSTAVFAGSLAAQPSDQVDRQDPKPSMKHGQMMKGQMDGMGEHMQEMRQLMQEIKNTDDPQERQELMRQHEQAMQDGMNMMEGQGMGGGDNQNMEERMQMMQQRMEMMQEMMSQMIQHQEAMRGQSPQSR